MTNGWRPSARVDMLRARADLLAALRAFFRERDVMEVDTPLLGSATVTDPQIEAITADYRPSPHAAGQLCYLQTSPEYFIKRLLAAGVPDCYQLDKVFRGDDAGARHNPEFTLLEWYRLGWSLDPLMAEVSEVMESVVGAPRCERIRYRDLFQSRIKLDPLRCQNHELVTAAGCYQDVSGLEGMPRKDWLDLLMATAIEPALGWERPVIVYDFPESHAALAELAHDEEGIRVAKRFELYWRGLELANGYQELTDSDALRQRFMQDNRERRQRGLAQRVLDDHFLTAMATGLPACSGVAMGVDRVLMAQQGVERIGAVMPFAWSGGSQA